MEVEFYVSFVMDDEVRRAYCYYIVVHMYIIWYHIGWKGGIILLCYKKKGKKRHLAIRFKLKVTAKRFFLYSNFTAKNIPNKRRTLICTVTYGIWYSCGSYQTIDQDNERDKVYFLDIKIVKI